MKSNLQTLSETTGYSEAELKERKTEPILQPHDCLEAMDMCTKRFALELINWLRPLIDKEINAMTIDCFLKSKELQK